MTASRNLFLRSSGETLVTIPLQFLSSTNLYARRLSYPPAVENSLLHFCIRLPIYFRYDMVQQTEIKRSQAMRIQDSSSLRELDKNTKSASSAKKNINSFFAEELSSREGDVASYQDDVESLRTEIDKAGNLLATEPTLANFKHFRDLLSKLAKRVSAEAYRLDKFGGTPQNPRYFEIITVIDREADNLYNLIVRENRDSMAITAKVIGIKGLVVDLVT